MKEGKIIFRDFYTGELLEGVLEKDNMFWGGYKVSCGNSTWSINLIKNIQYDNVESKGVDTVKEPSI